MKRPFIVFLSLLSFVPLAAAMDHTATIWQIGLMDRSARELALAPDQYQRYLQHDFG